MKCLSCGDQETKIIKIGEVEIDSCPACQGFWFDFDELRKAKDEKVKQAKWFDFDLWQDETRFKTVPSEKKCPVCNEQLYRINYQGADIEIDICKNRHGIWLDRGEFQKIIAYVKEKAPYEIIKNYAKVLLQETKEVVSGPESLGSELEDLGIVLSLFKYKFAAQHPIISIILQNLPFTK